MSVRIPCPGGRIFCCVHLVQLTPQLMGTWVFSTFWLLGIMPLRTLVHKVLCGPMSSCLLGIYCRVELQGHMVTLCFTFGETVLRYISSFFFCLPQDKSNERLTKIKHPQRKCHHMELLTILENYSHHLQSLLLGSLCDHTGTSGLRHCLSGSYAFHLEAPCSVFPSLENTHTRTHVHTPQHLSLRRHFLTVLE